MPVNINAQTWLDEKYPQNGACKRENDKDNKGKKRKEITHLNISKRKIGNNFFNNGKTFFGSLKFEGFTNLRTLIISSHQLIELDVSECASLEELDCSDNELVNLNITNCLQLQKIHCFKNNIKYLNLNGYTRLEEINFAGNNSLEGVEINGCLKLVEIGPEFSRKESKLIKNISRITLASENSIRNILIIGITGNGKSALANVLGNTSITNEFKEEESCISVTRYFQASEIFQWKGKKYRIVDNIGFGDTNDLIIEDVLFEIGKGIYAAKEGINQVLFTFSGRFSDDQKSAFNMFRDFIDETGITRVVTLVRNNFELFQNPEECRKDKEKLLGENEELTKTIESSNGIIYVDNPPISISIPDDEEEGEKKHREKAINLNKKLREKSREIVLDYLAEKCLEIYKVKRWDSIHEQVTKYMKKKDEIEKKSISSGEKRIELENERQILVDDVRIRLGINPATLDAYIEVQTKNCCIIS